MKQFFLDLAPTNLSSQLLIRLSVGLIFFTQGILKYTDPNLGVFRFSKIGFPLPDFTAHFVGTFEVICGFLITVGLFLRLASIPLLVHQLDRNCDYKNS